MPTSAPRPCLFIGCPQLTKGGYCKAHAKQKQDDYRAQKGSPSAQGYDWRWVKFREGYKRLHPFCVHCYAKGIITPMDEIDHKIPVSGPHDPLFFDLNNLQSLCTPCHSRKTQEDIAKGLTK